jgi:phosphoribosylformimino-5-aminoimidazole carboxamide ribotide isomerase
VQVIPAVDLLGEDATRLEQGDYDRELFRRPATAYMEEVAATSPPLIHLVDLEAARSGTLRPDVLGRCLRAAGSVPVQVAGGIRTIRDAETVLALGAVRVLIGTAAFASRDGPSVFATRFGDALCVAIDVRDGFVNVAGWLDRTTTTVQEAAARCVDSGVLRVLGTSIARDGTLDGPELGLYRELCGHPLMVLAAGGIRSLDDVEALEGLGCEGAITGRAFAEGLLRGP